MASNLTGQVRDIATVTTAVANGDLTRKITVDVKGELLELKRTINTMVDQLNAFSEEVTRVAREVGTEGKLGGQAEVRGVSGVWRDLTDNVNLLARNLTEQVRGIARVVTAVANGNLDQKLTLSAKGEIGDVGRHDQRHDCHAVDIRRAGHRRGARRGRGRPTRRSGRRAWRRRCVARSDEQRERARRQPDASGARDRRRRDRGDERRPDTIDHGRRARRSRAAQRQRQPDDRHARRDYASSTKSKTGSRPTWRASRACCKVSAICSPWPTKC